MVEKQNINIPLIVTIGLVSTVLLFVIFVGLQAWFYSEVEDEQVIKNTGRINLKLADHDLAQREKMNHYRMVDSQKQIVAIPIDEAIKLTAKKHEAR